MNEVTKWVTVEYGVKTLKEFVETFTVEEIIFDAIVYSEFSLATMSVEDITEIQGESEYRVHHAETGYSFDTDYMDLEELRAGLE